MSVFFFLHKITIFHVSARDHTLRSALTDFQRSPQQSHYTDFGAAPDASSISKIVISTCDKRIVVIHTRVRTGVYANTRVGMICFRVFFALAKIRSRPGFARLYRTQLTLGLWRSDTLNTCCLSRISRTSKEKIPVNQN